MIYKAFCTLHLEAVIVPRFHAKQELGSRLTVEIGKEVEETHLADHISKNERNVGDLSIFSALLLSVFR